MSDVVATVLVVGVAVLLSLVSSRARAAGNLRMSEIAADLPRDANYRRPRKSRSFAIGALVVAVLMGLMAWARPVAVTLAIALPVAILGRMTWLQIRTGPPPRDR